MVKEVKIVKAIEGYVTTYSHCIYDGYVKNREDFIVDVKKVMDDGMKDIGIVDAIKGENEEYLVEVRQNIGYMVVRNIIKLATEENYNCYSGLKNKFLPFSHDNLVLSLVCKGIR